MRGVSIAAPAVPPVASGRTPSASAEPHQETSFALFEREIPHHLSVRHHSLEHSPNPRACRRSPAGTSAPRDDAYDPTRSRGSLSAKKSLGVRDGLQYGLAVKIEDRSGRGIHPQMHDPNCERMRRAATEACGSIEGIALHPSHRLAFKSAPLRVHIPRIAATRPRASSRSPSRISLWR